MALKFRSCKHQRSRGRNYTSCMSTDTRALLAQNLQILCDVLGKKPAEVAKKAGLSQRSINGWGRGEKSARIDSVDALARALNVPPWLMIYPNLRGLRADPQRLSFLIDTYSRLPDEGRAQILRVAEAEARYHARDA